MENSAVSYHHGAGPIAVKMLVDEGVEVVFANELGIGASELLKQHNITIIPVKLGTNVGEAAKKVLRTHRESDARCDQRTKPENNLNKKQ